MSKNKKLISIGDIVGVVTLSNKKYVGQIVKIYEGRGFVTRVISSEDFITDRSWLRYDLYHNQRFDRFENVKAVKLLDRASIVIGKIREVNSCTLSNIPHKIVEEFSDKTAKWYIANYDGILHIQCIITDKQGNESGSYDEIPGWYRRGHGINLGSLDSFDYSRWTRAVNKSYNQALTRCKFN